MSCIVNILAIAIVRMVGLAKPYPGALWGGEQSAWHPLVVLQADKAILLTVLSACLASCA